MRSKWDGMKIVFFPLKESVPLGRVFEINRKFLGGVIE